MRFLDVGPEPIQVTGYRGGEGSRRPRQAGGQHPLRKVSEFYAATRDRNWPWTYSAVCLLAPTAVLAVSVWVAARVFDPKSILGSSAPDAAAKLCKTSPLPRQFQNALTATALHFAVSHMAFLLAGAFAFVFALWAIRNVVAIHANDFVERLGPLWISLAGVFVLGLAVYGLAIPNFALLSDSLFRELNPTAQSTASLVGATCLETAGSLSAAFKAQAAWGVALVAFGSAALAGAAATIAYRFGIHEIDGVWADTYVLRHKLKALLTLFVLGSLLMVSSNIALSAYADLGASVIEALQPPKSDDSGADQGGAAIKEAGATKAGDEFAKAATLRKAVLNGAGALSSLVLVAMFLPAFAGLTGDIEMAGKTHADADMRADPEPREVRLLVGPFAWPANRVAKKRPISPANMVAGYKTVTDWKTNHGLALEFSDVATAMAAAAAPLLSNGVFDVTKSIFGAS